MTDTDLRNLSMHLAANAIRQIASDLSSRTIETTQAMLRHIADGLDEDTHLSRRLS